MATTWWAGAWMDAVEGIAGGRGGRMARGRRLARQQPGADLTIRPGGVEAAIIDDRPDPYEVFVGIRAFRDDEWDAVFEAIAAKASHAAALLDGELDPAVVDDAAAVEVDLLPRPRDLHTVCTCADDAEPCVHGAAVCTLLADALASDPFVLLLVRGRRRDEVLEGIRRARSRAAGTAKGTTAEPASAAGADATSDRDEVARPGADPAEAWAREPGPLPALPRVVQAPSRPAAWPSEPPAHAPFDGPGLRGLVTDAARRAWDLLVGGSETGLELDARADLARRLVGVTTVIREAAAERAEVPAVELEQLSVAWEFGGAAGVRAVDEPRWNPPPLEMALARDQVVDAGMTPRRVHVSGNRVTAEGRVQFRRSRDGCWYAFVKDTGRWTLAAPPERQIDDLIDVLFD